MAILVTGGTGFIGSHTVVELLNRNKEVVIADNLCNSKEEVLNRIYQITGKRVKFYKVDLRNYADSRKIFEENEIDSIIHFAGLKSVGESVKYPELYFDNNLGSTNTILKLMKEFGVKNLVFSSSATVYGVPKHVPMVETDEIGGCTNPYGQTKYEIERILQREYKEDPLGRCSELLQTGYQQYILSHAQ
jgi:UDP-glucose 4-epimerase